MTEYNKKWWVEIKEANIVTLQGKNVEISLFIIFFLTMKNDSCSTRVL